MLETKEQGRKRKCSTKKRPSQNFFQAISKKKKKKASQKFFRRSPQKNVFQKIFQALHKILTIQKIVLFSSRGQGSFRGLEALRPRPRTSSTTPSLGETKCSFSIRKTEHLADIRHLQFDKSALTKYVFDNEHSMDWTNAKILDFKLDFTKRRFIESYFINQIPNAMNDEQNDKFPSLYSAALLQTT